jgi:NAD(P)-dependent dehydrogenase (short-subunit alcohol dehydrogenase family)
VTDKTVWFVTGAGRGMGVDIVKAALAAGHAVVATGRNLDAVARALGGTVNVTRATRARGVHEEGQRIARPS